MLNIKMFEELSSAFGPSGFEEEVARTIKKYSDGLILEPDAMNNVYMQFPNSERGDRPLIMLDAHTDEVGFMVQSIEENGLISIVTLGHFVVSNLPAHPVIIRTQSGEKIRGLINSKTPHFLTAEQRANDKLSIENLKVDVGATNKREVVEDMGINIGDPIVPDSQFSYDEKRGIFLGKAFDDRIGCACLIETMKRLVVEKLNVDVVGTFSTQEEAGLRGASVVANRVNPDLAIVFEGSPSDDKEVPASLAQSVLKGGVQIRHMDQSYISNPEFIRHAHSIARKHNIKTQSTVRRGGGTNAGTISIAKSPIPVLVLGVPSRYIHTHYSYCALEDINSTIDIAVEVVKSLNCDSIDKILKKNILD